MQRLMALIVVLAICTAANAAYTETQLKTDYENGVKLAAQIFDRAAQVSNQLSGVLVKDDLPTVTFSASDLTVLKTQVSGAAMVRPVKRGLGIRGIRPAGPAPVGLTGMSREFFGVCGRMATELSAATDEADRLRSVFHSLLITPMNAENRWFFAGIADSVSTNPAIVNTDSAKAIAALLPALHAESRQAAQKINWKFGLLLSKVPAAAESLKVSSQTQWTPPRKMTRGPADPGAMIQLDAPGQQQQQALKPPSKRAKGLWGNIWNDITNNAQEDLEQGADYGSLAGSVVGTVAGGIAGNTAFGPYGITYGMAEGYEIGESVGTAVGGAIGVIGGAIGTAAGWIVGTIESRSGQASTVKRMTRGGGGGEIEGTEPQQSDQVQLF